MDVNFTREPGVLIAAPLGRIESNNANQFQKHMKEALEGEETGLIIDMTDLNYISSAGLRVVAIMVTDTRAKAMKLAMCSMSNSVESVFITSGFNQIVKIYKTRDEAITALAE